MFTVTNRIQVKKGFGVKMAPAFTTGKELTTFEGFHKVEVQVSTQHEEYDELNVVMYWETLDNFQTWKQSDAFKKAHSRGKDGHGEGHGEGHAHAESPVISNQVVIAEIVSALTV